jgi:hypothetical protein
VPSRLPPRRPAARAGRSPARSRPAAHGAGTAGPDRPGRSCVARAGRGTPAGPQTVQRRLDVVRGLGHGLVGEPVAQRRLVVRQQRAHVQVRRLRGAGRRSGCPGLQGRLARGQRDPVDVAAGPRAQLPVHDEPDTAAVAGVRVQPGPHRARLERAALDVEALLRLGLGAGQRGEQALAQHPELQLVEQPVHGLAVPRPRHEVVRGRVELDVADQLRQLAVEQHVREVRAQRVARLALHLVHPVRQRLQRAELAHPLGCRLLADARDVRQVVAGIPAQRGEVRVLRRRQPVAGHHRVRVDPAELGDSACRVEHRDVVADQLERVAVTRGHEHPVALRLGLRGERGDDVVGLEVVDREERDRQRREDVLDEVDLPAEVVRRRTPVGLVLREPLGAERDA